MPKAVSWARLDHPCVHVYFSQTTTYFEFVHISDTVLGAGGRKQIENDTRCSVSDWSNCFSKSWKDQTYILQPTNRYWAPLYVRLCSKHSFCMQQQIKMLQHPCLCGPYLLEGETHKEQVKELEYQTAVSGFQTSEAGQGSERPKEVLHFCSRCSGKASLRTKTQRRVGTWAVQTKHQTQEVTYISSNTVPHKTPPRTLGLSVPRWRGWKESKFRKRK